MQEKRIKTKNSNKNKLNIIKLKKYIFIMLIVIFSINIIISTLFFINGNTKYRLFERAYVEAVLPGQNINEPLNTGVVKAIDVDSENINVGDYIIVYGDYGLDENWVEIVIENDSESTFIVSSYSTFTALEVDKDDVLGVFVEEANFLGLIFYFSSFVVGYILIFCFEAIIVFAFYFYLLREKKGQVNLDRFEEE